jgi:hypothetical protein
MGLADKILAFDVWYMKNLDDTSQSIQGQFVAINPTENIKVKYAAHGALGRQSPIIQFLSGEAKEVSFQIKLHGRDFLFTKKMNDDLKMLKSWTKINSKFSRPPVLSFWIGDQIAETAQCVVTSLSGIRYGKPSILGQLREVELTMNLMEYSAYSLEGIDGGETRYHRSGDTDYYEMLCQREYNNPMIGDVIRKRNPDKQNILRADIIKLPSIEVVRKDVTEPKSIPLYKAFSNKENAQKLNRIASFERTNREKTSYVVAE